MKIYESTREILNPCANIYNFDTYFPQEIQCDNLELYLETFLNSVLPPHTKETFDDGTIVYILNLPRLERYTFTPI